MTLTAADFATIGTSVAAALAEIEGAESLPLASLSIHELPFSGTAVLYIRMRRDYREGHALAGVHALAQWAAALNADVVLSLGHGTGSADFSTRFAGYDITFASDVGTAQAYLLGAMLGEPLDDSNQSVTATAAELLAACEAETAATS